MRQCKNSALTKDQKVIVRQRLNDLPKDIATSIGADFNKVRLYQWHQKKRVEEPFNCCPITGYKKSY